MDKSYTRPTARSRELRLNATEPERRLWQVLSARKVAGIRFNRQFPIGPYICDFVSRGARLIVEVDGDSHAHAVGYDAARTEFLEREGYQVLRFWNSEVMDNLAGVVTRIEQVLSNRPPPSPSRRREGSLWGETVRWTRKR